MAEELSPSYLIIKATERWHSVPRRFLPPLARAEFIDAGDKQYIRMLATADELIGMYEVLGDGNLKSLPKPWPVLSPLSSVSDGGGR